MLPLITDKEFNALRDIMYRRTGVFLKDTKKPLVTARLRKRLEELKLDSFRDYVSLLERSGSDELEAFINALTTNETYFFRHTKQFNYLYAKSLPEIKEKKGGRETRLWTAACATGEEPYSIAITCQEFSKKNPGFSSKIYASDVNSQVIQTAQEAIYSERSLKELSPDLLGRYFDEGFFDETKKWKQFQLKSLTQSKVEFRQHNLLDVFPEKNMDIIFLRNVMIYFDNQSKQRVVGNIEKNLSSGGYLFISLSESLNDVKTALKEVFSGVYQKV